MSLNEIEELLKKIIEDEFISDKEKKSVSSKIKRLYNIKRQELKSNGKNFSYQSISRLINIIIGNYDKFKDNSIINEVMQEIAEEYSKIEQTKKVTKEAIDKRVMIIYQNILGNPGTNTNEMTSEFISNIIRLKLTEDEGINREDILNILKMQSKNMYQDIEEYQKLIEDTVIAHITYNENAQKFTNPRILEILGDLAGSYKVTENFDRTKQIYKQALKMRTLENTPEYQELRKHYEEFLDFLEMKKSFEYKKYDSFEELMKSLKIKFTQKPIFKKGEGEISQNSDDAGRHDTQKESGYVMPTELKLEGLKKLAMSLKEVNDDFDITCCEVGKDSYDGYVIFKIDNANVSILENFNEINARSFIIKNELIEQVRQLSRNNAIAVEGVEGVNHVSNFDNYCRNLKNKTLKLIAETSINKKQEDLEATFENIEQNDASSNQTNEEKVEGTSNLDKTTTEEVAIENEEKEEKEPVDELEIERKKAHEHRKYIKQLEEEIARIEREEKEKIDKIEEKGKSQKDKQ